MNISVPIQLLDGAQLPAYQTSGAAGMDLYSTQRVVLFPGRRALVPTGIKLAIPEGYEGQIRPRSGLALKQGIGIVNSPGTIDSDYRGEVGIILINHGEDTITLDAGERIAQLVFAPVAHVAFTQVEDIADLPTERGEGGFGSTGVESVEVSFEYDKPLEEITAKELYIAKTPAERAAIGA